MVQPPLILYSLQTLPSLTKSWAAPSCFYSDPFNKLHLLLNERFVLGIVLDPGAREGNKINKNHVVHVGE